MLAKGMRAIGVTAAISDERSIRFDLFVQMKTAIAPSNSPTPEPSVTPSSSPSLPQTSQTPQTPQTPQATPSSSP
jgi:hypothetical protein